MEEKLIFTRKVKKGARRDSCVVRVSKKAMALINCLCAETEQAQQEIASKLIEWAYDHAEVVEDGDSE